MGGHLVVADNMDVAFPRSEIVRNQCRRPTDAYAYAVGVRWEAHAYASLFCRKNTSAGNVSPHRLHPAYFRRHGKQAGCRQEPGGAVVLECAWGGSGGSAATPGRGVDGCGGLGFEPNLL